MLETLWAQDGIVECGCDEAGRGCLAGDVYAAAVIWNPEVDATGVRDSKTLSEKQRMELRRFIESHAVAYAVGVASVEEIAQINILHAAIRAMHRAVDGLFPFPGRILVDGNRFSPHPSGVEHHCIVKGDNRYVAIAAASILAKTHRDEYMNRMHRLYPCYRWEKNKGYPTEDHREAVRLYGISPLHRKEFKGVREMLPIDAIADSDLYHER